MNDKDTIQALKDNRTAFGWMDQDLQDKANTISKSEFQCAAADKIALNWNGMIHNDKPFYAGLTYRLRSDYSEEPRLIECEVFNGEGVLRFNKEPGATLINIALPTAPGFPDFIGFKYEDGGVCASPRLYKLNGSDTQVALYPLMGDYEVLTPTAVLFRKDR